MKWWVLGIACAVGLLIALVSSFVKGFWKSLWEDFSGVFKDHWLKIIGGLLMYVGPFVFFVVAYMTTTATEGTEASVKITMPIFVYLIGIPALLIYWIKLRKALSDKIVQMKAVNEVQRGKHYAMLVANEVLKQAMCVATIAMLYCAVSFMESIFSQASTGILVFFVFASLGGVLMILDSVFYYAADHIEKPDKKEDNGGGSVKSSPNN